jgi:hypothetical protein
MAKRAKKKRVSRPIAIKKQTKTMSPVTEVHVLGVAGGIVTLLAGILWLIGSLLHWQLQMSIFGDLGIINIVCGLVLLISSATLKKNFLATGLVLLVFSIIAFIAPPAGFIVGPILAAIGGIIALVKSANFR